MPRPQQHMAKAHVFLCPAVLMPQDMCWPLRQRASVPVMPALHQLVWQVQGSCLALNPPRPPLVPHPARRHDFDLDKLRQQEGGYVYRYKYNGAGASATWTSQHNFVVIDVSAGPCHYGPVTSRAGAVMPQALPEVQVSTWHL